VSSTANCRLGESLQDPLAPFTVTVTVTDSFGDRDTFIDSHPERYSDFGQSDTHRHGHRGRLPGPG
jgi:hypothetical protein